MAAPRPFDFPGGTAPALTVAPAVTAIVLSGGRSTRMGRDKGTLPLGGETMLERVVRIVRPIVGEVIVVARQDQDAPKGVRIVRDPVDDLGPLAGIAAGLSASRTDVNLVIACDMPLIRTGVLEHLVSQISDHDACVAMVDGHASALCGAYRSRLADAAHALLESGERRVMALLDRVRTKRVDAALLRDLDPDLETFVSCDTPEVYRSLSVRLAATPDTRSSQS